MSTLNYVAQSGLTRSCTRLLATDLLLLLEEESTQKTPNRLLKRKQDIFNQGIKYLNSVNNGFYASHYGRHSVAFPESVNNYHEISARLGSEASCRAFPIQINGYCRTIETLASGQQPSSENINELKTFLKRISPDSDKREPSQANTESLLKSLSYVSP